MRRLEYEAGERKRDLLSSVIIKRIS